MKRSECYMTFSEALDAYMEATHLIEHFGEGRNRESARGDLVIAKAHMDALTGPPEMRWMRYDRHNDEDDLVLQFKNEENNWENVPETNWNKARREGSL